jgi:hypothetical protein
MEKINMDLVNAYMFNPGNFGPEELLGLWPTNASKYLQWTDSSDLLSIWVDTDGSSDPLGNLQRYVLSSKSKYKIMVLVEPKGYCMQNYEWVLENHYLFDLIMSSYPDYGSGNPKFKYFNGGLRSYISKEEWNVYPKSMNISSVMSNRKQLPGHILRHEIRNEVESFVDYLNPTMTRKVDALKDYRFEIVIENEDSPNFSEKLLDSMLCGCVPIYWNNSPTEYLDVFDKSGIELFSSKDEIVSKIKSGYFNEELYNSKMDAIKNNFEVAQKFVSLGDVLWEYGIKELIQND